jgi:molybdopterin converting factor small subunit
LSITVTVKFLANVEIFMGKREVTVTLDEGRKQTVGEVIAQITKMENKDLKSKLMDEKGKSRTTVRIVLNDRLLLQDASEAQVKNGDTLLIFPLLAGGSGTRR